MRYTHWFWDFDGTLYNTYPRIVRAFQKALKSRDIRMADEDIFPLVKNTLGHAARTIGGDEHAQALLDTYFEHAEDEGPDTLLPYKGLEEVLSFIVNHGGRSYVYTHRDKTGPEALERAGLLHFFADAITDEDGFPSKPAPDALLHMMRKHGLNPRDCVMVGDRPIDLDAGINAGMQSILFDEDGFYPEYPGVTRFESYAQMLEALKNGQI